VITVIPVITKAKLSPFLEIIIVIIITMLLMTIMIISPFIKLRNYNIQTISNSQ
jgi:hypothetical protein